MKDLTNKLITDTDKAFSLYVLFILSILTVPITLREAFTKQDIVYYELQNFPINKIASYHISVIYFFLIFLVIIHANKLLIILSDVIALLIPFLEQKLGIMTTKQQQNEPNHNQDNNQTGGIY